MIIGKGGQMLKKIGSAARMDIEELLGVKVSLNAGVKVREDWRDNEQLLNSLGFALTMLPRPPPDTPVRQHYPPPLMLYQKFRIPHSEARPSAAEKMNVTLQNGGLGTLCNPAAFLII